MLSAEVRFLNQKVRELCAENERLELEVTHFKAKSLDLSSTQAGKLSHCERSSKRLSKTQMAWRDV